MRLRTTILWAAATAIATSGVPPVYAKSAAANGPSDPVTAVRLAANGEMKRAGSPSLQIAASYDGVMVVDQAFGMADLEHGVPATTISRYRTASVAKWFTATEAMRLVAAGRVDLDAPIQQYCAGFPKKPWPVTTRELLAHTSGIRHDPDYETDLKNAKTDTERLVVVTRREREALGRFTRYTNVVAPLANFADDALLFQPGTQWSYSSPDYRVLSCVIQGAAGKPYAAVMQDDIFAPLGMSHTLPDDAWAIIPGRARLYQVANAKLELRQADYRDVSENLAAGGYLSTAADMLAFAQAFANGKLVSQDKVALMTTPVVVAGMVPNEANSPVEVPEYGRYGYGVMLFPADEGRWFGHTGRQDGASAILAVSPDRRCAVAVMMNVRSWAKGFDFVRSVCAALAKRAPR